MSYVNFEEREKKLLVKEITSLLISFCQTKKELDIFFSDIEKQIRNFVKFQYESQTQTQHEDDGDDVEVKKGEDSRGNEVKVKGKVGKDFDSLSPNVIIYEILPFYLMKSENVDKEFDLFGYFKESKKRDIWFLICSLEINSGQYPYKHCGFYYCAEKLKYFQCHNYFKKRIDSNDNKNGINFINLEGLKVYNDDDDDDDDEYSIELVGDVLKKLSFCKKLKSIYYTHPDGYEDKMMEIDLSVNKCTTGISQLSIKTGTISSLRGGKMLRYLKLDQIDFSNLYKNDTVCDLKNVETLLIWNLGNNLKIEMCSFFSKHRFENLKIFDCSCCFQNSFEKVTVNWKKLLKIRFSYVTGLNDTFFLKNKFEKLEKLTLNELPLITGKSWNVDFNKIKRFSVRECNKLELMNQKWGKLQKLYIFRCNKIDLNQFDQKITETCNQQVFQMLKRMIKKIFMSFMLKSTERDHCSLHEVSINDRDLIIDGCVTDLVFRDGVIIDRMLEDVKIFSKYLKNLTKKFQKNN